VEGWDQFEKDVAEYVPAEIVEKPTAEVSIELPALFVHAKGEITTSNMKEYGLALADRLEKVRAIQLVTDQDFSNAEAAAKLFREQCQKLKLAKEAMLEQTLSIGEAARMIDAWHEDLRVTALKLEKDVEKEKEAKKINIVTNARNAYGEYIASLEKEISPIRLELNKPDFALAMKGKKLFSAMQNAVDNALANAKIEADSMAKDIRSKLAWCKEIGDGMSFLFPDLQQIITKAMDDFKLLVSTRIERHKTDEAAKIEAQRVRIQQEEEAKARKKVQDEIDRDAAAFDKRVQDRTPGGSVPAIKMTDSTKAPSRPSDDELIDALSLRFRVHESKVIEWLLDMDLNAAAERLAEAV
ncbi:MAG: endonuclease, partial [Pseudomonadota bacterium]|nr:endonuclease [Pseudomonadota bacterium]